MALRPIRFGSSPEATPKRPLVLGSASPSPSSCITADVFLARTFGLDATHVAAYKALICGLVADGVWTKLDILRVYATQDSTTALLNLTQNLYNGTAHGSPVFTADRGFIGVSGSSAVYISGGFIPPTSLYTQNDAHISTWSVIDVGMSDTACIGANDAAQIFWSTAISPKTSDGNLHVRINNLPSAPNPGIAVPNSTGHYVANRSSNVDIQGYRNGTLVIAQTGITSALPNNEFFTLAYDRGATAQGAPHQLAMESIGSGLTPTDVTNLYNRLRTYMTTVGVP